MVGKDCAWPVVLCFAIAACADSAADSSVTAPHTRQVLGVSPQGFDVMTPFGGDEKISVAPRTGTTEAATGGRASGHFDLAEPFFSIVTEQYSFIALSTGFFPDAKGELDAKIARSNGTQEIHAEVDCLVVNGNEAWMSGPMTRFVRDGVSLPPNGRQVAWRVRDNGEGANASPDVASVLFVGFPQACLVYFFSEDLPMVPRANIQVSQR